MEQKEEASPCDFGDDVCVDRVCGRRDRLANPRLTSGIEEEKISEEEEEEEEEENILTEQHFAFVLYVSCPLYLL